MRSVRWLVDIAKLCVDSSVPLYTSQTSTTCMNLTTLGYAIAYSGKASRFHGVSILHGSHSMDVESIHKNHCAQRGSGALIQRRLTEVQHITQPS